MYVDFEFLLRFWYETSEASVKFTEAQLTEIRKITLAKVNQS